MHALAHRDLEAAKWIGIVSMTVDHYGKIVAPEIFAQTYCIGRLAFPLFAGIVGMRLSLSPALGLRYVRALLPWAMVSQPVFVLAGRHWYEGNVLFTLALGVAVDLMLTALARGQRLVPAIALLAVAAAAPWVEYGAAGVAMIPLMAVLARRGGAATALWAFGPLGVLANLVPRAPFLSVTDLFALGATPVALASPCCHLPRLPRFAFYAYYPAHLLVLHFADAGLPRFPT